MPWQRPPQPQAEELFLFEDPFAWPFMKFDGLEREDLFGRLHDRFNKAPISILDAEAWHADVVELVRSSDTIEELYALLEERRTQRLAELKAAIQGVDISAWNLLFHSPLLSDLGRTLQRMHSNATMFDAFQVFSAMASLWEHESDAAKTAAVRLFPPAKNISVECSTSGVEHHIISTTESDTGVAKPSPSALLRTSTSPHDESSPDTRRNSSRGRKRKSYDTDPESVPHKRPRASAAQSDCRGDATESMPTRPAPYRRDSSRSAVIESERNKETENLSHAKTLGVSGLTAQREIEEEPTVEQERIMTDMSQDNGVSKPRTRGNAEAKDPSDSETRDAGNSEVGDPEDPETPENPGDPEDPSDSETENSSDFMDCPPERPELCHSQQPPTKINYAMLGWTIGRYPSPIQMPGFEEHGETDDMSQPYSGPGEHGLEALV